MSTKIQMPFLVDEGLARVVEALAWLQDHRGSYWELVPSLTPEEGQEIVTAVTLLKGESIDFTWNSLNLGLDHWGRALEDLVDGRAHSFLLDQDMWLDMEGVRIPIGRVRTHIETTRLADPETVQRAVRSGSLSQLRLVPGDSDRGQRTVVS